MRLWSQNFSYTYTQVMINITFFNKYFKFGFRKSSRVPKYSKPLSGTAFKESKSSRRTFFLNHDVGVIPHWRKPGTYASWIQIQCLKHRRMRRLKTKSNFSYQPIATAVPEHQADIIFGHFRVKFNLSIEFFGLIRSFFVIFYWRSTK